MDGALWVLSKVRCEKGLFAHMTKKIVGRAVGKIKKEPM